MLIIRYAILALTLIASSAARAETKGRMDLPRGENSHGAFGPFIPVGIRIGLDAKEKLHAHPRGLTVTYYNGTKPPCPCIADGIMIATQASPGQGTLQIAPEKALDGLMAVIVIKDRKTGEGFAIQYRTSGCPRYFPGSSPIRRRATTWQ